MVHSAPEELAARAARFGSIGECLLGVFLSSGSPWYSSSGSFDFGGIAASLFSSFRSLAVKDVLLPLAVALLALPYPLQCDVDEGTLLRLFTVTSGLSVDGLWSVPPCTSFLCIARRFGMLPPSVDLRSAEMEKYYGSICDRVLYDSHFREAAFPHKAHSAVFSKGNLRLVPLIESAIKVLSRSTVGRFITLLGGVVHNDVFQSFLLYGLGVDNVVPRVGFSIAYKYVTDSSYAKEFSTALKAFGAGQIRLGAMLLEGNVLVGRAATGIDLSADRDYRLSESGVAEKVLHANQDELAVHVRAIIESELREVKFPDMEHFWEQRWLWCVNGSHSAAASERLGIDHDLLTQFHTQTYRRMAAESCAVNPIPEWDGVTLVSCSEKLEHGKSRAIYACDTLSYFAFEYLLGPVQSAWRNRRVLLDPGGGGHSGIAARVRKSFLGGGVNLMLDYDDFNSHHSTESMQTVIRVLSSIVGLEKGLASTLVNSFDRTYCNRDGVWEKVHGTLMSGHRGTTFINSVLNAAYLRHAWGAQTYDKLFALHAGDDVFIRVDELSMCAPLLDTAARYGCRMNPAKQSLGNRVAEFLRMAITPQVSMGYFARSVASIVSGNWTNVDKLAPLEAIQTVIVSARSCINRSGCTDLANVIGNAMRYRANVPHKVLRELCAGTVALEGTPVFQSVGYARTVKVRAVTPRSDKLAKAVKMLPSHATSDYLSKCVTSVEEYALQLAGVSPATEMLATSYGKGFNIGTGRDEPALIVSKPRLRRLHGKQTSSELLSLPSERGALMKYPLLHLLENRLTDEDLQELCASLGLIVTGHVREFCFGGLPRTISILGFLSYADAAMLSKRATADSIIVLNHVFV